LLGYYKSKYLSLEVLWCFFVYSCWRYICCLLCGCEDVQNNLKVKV